MRCVGRSKTAAPMASGCCIIRIGAASTPATPTKKTLRTLGIECSMSRTGCCYDNAAMERFFWSLKHEWTNHQTFANLEEARLSVFKYIETLYNEHRPHSGRYCYGKTPMRAWND